MTYEGAAVAARDQDEARRRVVQQLRAKRGFWRQVSWFSVLNLAFWLSWLIGGVRDEWVAPWPLIPTVLWGSFLLYRAHRLGGRQAVSHDTIAHQIDQLRHPGGPVYRDHLTRRPITFGYEAGYEPLRPFHLQDIIDLRESQPADDTASRN